MSTTGKRMRLVRKHRKLSLNEVSRLTGISKSHLSNVERDLHAMTTSPLVKVADALNVSLDFLLRGGAFPTTGGGSFVEVPEELSMVALELGLPFRSALAILAVHRTLSVYRWEIDETPPSRKYWHDLVARVGSLVEAD